VAVWPPKHSIQPLCSYTKGCCNENYEYNGLLFTVRSSVM